MNGTDLLADAERCGVTVRLVGRDVEFEGYEEWISAHLGDIERLSQELCLIVRIRESAKPAMGKVLRFPIERRRAA